MKRSRLYISMLVLCIGCLDNINVFAQNTLPAKDAISIGSAVTLPSGKGENDFTDLHKNTFCFTADANYRHFLSPHAAVGATYQFYGTHSGKDLFRCHYIAPTLTFRALQNEATSSLYFTVGAGYFHYADRIHSRTAANHTFNHGYFGTSISLGYEWMIGKSISTQLHLDFLSAKWGENPDYEPKWQREDPNVPETMFEPKMSFVSLGLDLQFGK